MPEIFPQTQIFSCAPLLWLLSVPLMSSPLTQRCPPEPGYTAILATSSVQHAASNHTSFMLSYFLFPPSEMPFPILCMLILEKSNTCPKPENFGAGWRYHHLPVVIWSNCRQNIKRLISSSFVIWTYKG